MTPVEILRAAAARVRGFQEGTWTDVLLAVADWLDDSAARLEANEVARALEYVPKDYAAALAVARLLLPEEEMQYDRLIVRRDDLILAGVDPDDLLVPLKPLSEEKTSG